MRLIGKHKLEKLKRKNRGNVPLTREIDKLIVDIEKHEWKSKAELKKDRSDSDCVHNDGFYFFKKYIMQTDFDINKIIKQGKIQNELDFERVLIADRKLRVLSKENPEYISVRKKLRDLIEAWENKHWLADSEITDEIIDESDLAGSIAENERQFIEKRKSLIRARLKSLELSQQALGGLLGHKNKSYISELMNGITPFSLRDLIVINWLLKIDLTDLIPAFLSPDERIRIKASLEKLENTKLKLSKTDFAIA